MSRIYTITFKKGDSLTAMDVKDGLLCDSEGNIPFFDNWPSISSATCLSTVLPDVSNLRCGDDGTIWSRSHLDMVFRFASQGVSNLSLMKRDAGHTVYFSGIQEKNTLFNFFWRRRKTAIVLLEVEDCFLSVSDGWSCANSKDLKSSNRYLIQLGLLGKFDLHSDSVKPELEGSAVLSFVWDGFDLRVMPSTLPQEIENSIGNEEIPFWRRRFFKKKLLVCPSEYLG